MKDAQRISSVVHYTHCPVCGSAEIKKALDVSDHSVSKEGFEVWECHNCTMRFTQNIPIQSEIGRYYASEEYISHSGTKKGLVNRLYHMVRDYTLKQKRSFIKKVSGVQKGALLDIGCGTGDFLGIMKGAGWVTLGLEPDEGARALALETHGIETFPSEQLFELKDATYDVITMWHVLEHVHELKPYVEKIYRLLKPGGKLIIAVPNYTSKDAGIYGTHWAAYDVPRHLYHFSPAAMQRLITDGGFTFNGMKRMPFDSFYVSLLSEKYLHGSARLIPGFINGFRSYLSAAGNIEQCSSLIYIFTK